MDEEKPGTSEITMEASRQPHDIYEIFTVASRTSFSGNSENGDRYRY